MFFIFYFGECGMLELNKYVSPDKHKIRFLKYLSFMDFLFSNLYLYGENQVCKQKTNKCKVINPFINSSVFKAITRKLYHKAEFYEFG